MEKGKEHFTELGGRFSELLAELENLGEPAVKIFRAVWNLKLSDKKEIAESAGVSEEKVQELLPKISQLYFKYFDRPDKTEI